MNTPRPPGAESAESEGVAKAVDCTLRNSISISRFPSSEFKIQIHQPGALLWSSRLGCTSGTQPLAGAPRRNARAGGLM